MNVLPVLDHGYVGLIDRWGSDERIVEAARMSTAKDFRGWGTVDKPGDEKFLKFLWDNKHHSPFEMAGLTFEIQAPIFVFREWHRHRTQSYNELSARYTKLPDTYYVPTLERIMAGAQAKKNKQSSEAGITATMASTIQHDLINAYQHARNVYELLLDLGLARELARLVIPVAQYSRMRASGNLRNWLAFLTLRQDPGAQLEIRKYADAVGTYIKHNFPYTWSIFDGERQPQQSSAHVSTL